MLKNIRVKGIDNGYKMYYIWVSLSVFDWHDSKIFSSYVTHNKHT